MLLVKTELFYMLPCFEELLPARHAVPFSILVSLRPDPHLPLSFSEAEEEEGAHTVCGYLLSIMLFVSLLSLSRVRGYAAGSGCRQGRAFTLSEHCGVGLRASQVQCETENCPHFR